MKEDLTLLQADRCSIKLQMRWEACAHTLWIRRVDTFDILNIDRVKRQVTQGIMCSQRSRAVDE